MPQQSSTTFWDRYKPAVPRHWLLFIAGIIWTGVGTLLVSRAVSWLPTTSFTIGAVLEAIAIAMAGTGYAFGFYKVVAKNERRIHSLPPRACVFGFTAWRGYLMIGGMVTMGVLLRNSPLPKVYLILPYSAMGGVLILGSLSFYRKFWLFKPA